MAVAVDDGELINPQPMAGDENPAQLAEDMGITPADVPVDGERKLVGPAPPENDRCSYTWRVENFVRIRQQKQYSPVFYSGAHAWRLLMFPQGNNSPHLSVYLDAADGANLPQAWTRQAHFSLGVSNHLDPTRSVLKESDHMFHARANDWGFREFVNLNDARDPHVGFLQPDGSLLIECNVEVTWQPPQHLDSKKETGFVGLKNQGATCYMNSLLQTLAHIPSFRKAVYHMPTREDEDPESSIPLALQRIFYKLQHSDMSVSTKQLTKSFGWDTADTFMQHDVQELLRVLVDKLEDKMKGTSVEGTMSHLFEGKLTNYVKCVNVDDESRRDEAFYDLQLPVKGCRTILQSLDEYVKEETLDGDNQYHSDTYGKQDAKRGVRFKSLPPVLHLHLLRFEFDYATEQMAKINSRFEFPELLDLDADGRKYLTADSDPNVRNLYKLHSVLVHSGGLNGGHYYVYVQPFGGEHTNRWYKFDDDRVTCVPPAEAIEGSWGDDAVAELRPGQMQGYYRAGGPKVSSAYMLVYIRDSAVRELDCEVTDADIVPHLRAQLQRELLDKQRKRKERNEAHLYTLVKVATNSDLAKQISDGRWFDLLDHEAAPRFRVKKEETVADMKAMLARELGVPAHQQRLWTWVNRQNKTYRLDKPLQFDYADESPIMDVKEDAPPGHLHHVRTQAELRLYLEVVPAELSPPPPVPAAPLGAYDATEQMESELPQYPLLRNDDILLFVKFFDASTQALSFLGTHLARWADRLSDLTPVLRAMRGLDPAAELDVYEEVEFEMQVVFTPILEERTLKEAELQHGDILVFQTTPPPTLAPVALAPSPSAEGGAMSVDGADLVAEPLAGTPHTIPAFFEAVKNRVTVNLFKLPQHSDAANIREREPPVELRMDKRMSYDDVTAAVGRAIGCDPTHVRLTMHNGYTEQPKPQPIKFRGVDSLFDMLLGSAHKASGVLYYEVLEMPLSEFESKKSLRVSWHAQSTEMTKVLTLLLAKETTVAHALELILGQVDRELPIVDESGARLPVEACVRMLELFGHRIYKVLPYSDPIETINDQYWTIRAEEIPLDERHMDASEDKVVHVRHFYQDANLSTVNFGDPFLAVLTPSDTIGSLSRRIQARLKLPDDEMAKLKVGLVTFSRVEVIGETESVKARFRAQDNQQSGSWEDYIGIEHPAGPVGPGARRRNAARYHDKPIKIYG
ncbi:hypothetical protein KFE25_009009 [Diacronema lutheri]|uniref:ubiquitinyl hydrolase 1 n=3 Tax=Diacronema lutheri TaxID=2081491 RepID=A0A8J6CK20_DIALT|nr:hypothetical protein KFE25_009009 [Diacronema lutheri]